MPSGPKTNKFTNRHATEANERKAQVEAERRAAADTARDDALWHDEGDRKQQKRAEREEEQQRKLHEQQQRQRDKEQQLALEEREMAQAQPSKVTKRQMQRDVAKLVANYDKEMQKLRPAGESDQALQQPPAPPPQAQQKARGGQNKGGSDDEADDAKRPQAACAEVPDDRHIGKRAKVQYKLFFAEHYDGLKSANPGLRRSQLSDLVWELWQKSPQNPLVMRREQRDSMRLEDMRKWIEGDDDSSAVDDAK